ncbi:MAG: hypothetical protein ACPGEG_06040 [Salibacteraceae bacterium]
MIQLKNICLLILIITGSTTIYSQDLSDSITSKWYLPKYIKVQYAGNVGFISLGPSWSFYDEKLDVNFLVGYVPKFSNDKAIFSTTLKINLTPQKLTVNLGENICLNPFGIGLTLNHTHGKKFNKYGNTNQYEQGYYWWGVPLSSAFNLQSELQLKLKSKHLKRVSFYFEFTYWDVYFYSQLSKENIGVISFWDASTLGFGTKIYFKN